MWGTKLVARGLLLLMVAVLPVAGAEKPREASTRIDAPRAARPLAEVLTPDGSLRVRAGLRGTFDARGWRLAPGGGAPRFERATTPEDDRWAGDFSSPGTDDIIRAVAVRGAEVFVGGRFAAIGKTSARNIARWDGQRWSSLGEAPTDGVNGTVYTIAVSGKDVFVGGTFTTAGSAPAANVARWSGGVWAPLGDGEMNGVRGFGAIVYAIAPVGRTVYVGGYFSEAGGIEASNLARWDARTGSWSEVAGGVRQVEAEDPAYVFALTATRKTLYVGGKFSLAGEVSVSHIAALDLEEQMWSALGSGMNDWVNNIAVDRKRVYAGGFFTEAGGRPAAHVALWDGSTWSALGDGLRTPETAEDGVRVKGLAVVGKSLYVSGFFTFAGETRSWGAARWTGSGWEGLEGGLVSGLESAYPGDVLAFAATRKDVYVAGNFNTAGEGQAIGLARWNARQGGWSEVADPGPHFGVYDGFLDAVAVDGETVYVGGGPLLVGGRRAFGIARWDGETWSTLGEGPLNGVNGLVSTIAVTSKGIVVGGYFSRAGDVATQNIAVWDGVRWSGFGTGLGGSANAQVFAILEDGDSIYAGGYFFDAGGVAVNSIARWDGTKWQPLGKGDVNGTDGFVFALAKGADGIYAGGAFGLAGGVPARSIARWNGTAWAPLGEAPEDGVDGAVWALLADGDRLYVGGDFSVAGAMPANNLAVWEAGSWEELGGGVTTDPTGPEPFDYIFTLTLDAGRLIVGGYFEKAGDVATPHLAAWNGTMWEPLGSSVDGVVTGVAATPGYLYVGGGFALAGGKPSMRFARWEMNPQ